MTMTKLQYITVFQRLVFQGNLDKT